MKEYLKNELENKDKELQIKSKEIKDLHRLVKRNELFSADNNTISHCNLFNNCYICNCKIIF